MCGITGIYDFGGTKKIEEDIIRRMCSVLAHRGPDDEGVYCRGNIGLGHRRLSIIDLGGGHQPMSNEDGSVWIVFNGEIYNFLQLRNDLINKGHIFRTRCDTEVILHLYEEEKEACLQKLNGMFAFAIWDEKESNLFLARDRVGIKPLHYTVFGGKIIFASEIKAILQEPSVKREVDYEALHDYLSLIYVPAPMTMFKDIRKLPAGHYLICGKDKYEVKEYWDIDFSKVTVQTEAEICDNVYSKLKGCVNSHLISDVPLGAFLSGGIDSSSVVSLMARLQERPVITNSIGFSQKDYDELKYARIVAKRYRTDHHEYIVEPKALEILDKLLWFYDEPFGDASSIPTYYVSKITRQNMKVALSGDGGDENFAGYTRYLYSNALVNFQNMLPGFIKVAAKNISRALGRRSQNAWSMKIKNKVEEFYLPPFDLYFKIISMYKEEEKPRLYRESLNRRMRGYSSLENFRNIFQNCKSDDYISKLQYLDIKTYLCDDILVKVDRASMANSLEVRVPLLDYTLMEYAASIPASLKAGPASGKYIFKKAMAQDLPHEILNRPKMGFAVPMAYWLSNELKDDVEKELFDKNSIIYELFEPECVKKTWSLMLYNKLKGFKRTDLSYRIWVLFIFSRWFKKYIKNEQ